MTEGNSSLQIRTLLLTAHSFFVHRLHRLTQIVCRLSLLTAHSSLFTAHSSQPQPLAIGASHYPFGQANS